MNLTPDAIRRVMANQGMRSLGMPSSMDGPQSMNGGGSQAPDGGGGTFDELLFGNTQIPHELKLQIQAAMQAGNPQALNELLFNSGMDHDLKLRLSAMGASGPPPMGGRRGRRGHRSGEGRMHGNPAGTPPPMPPQGPPQVPGADVYRDPELVSAIRTGLGMGPAEVTGGRAIRPAPGGAPAAPGASGGDPKLNRQPAPANPMAAPRPAAGGPQLNTGPAAVAGMTRRDASRDPETFRLWMQNRMGSR